MSEQPDLMPVAAEDALPAQRDALSVLLDNPDRLKDIPVETVERLHAIHKEEREDARRLEFNAAMLAVEQAMTPVLKTASNEQTRSLYAKLDDIHRMLLPILKANGFSHSISGQDCPKGDDWTRFVLTLRHAGGFTETHFIDAPIDHLGPKGGPVKTKLHGMGSSYTYAKRQLLCGVFGVQLADDNDGNRVDEPITPEQVTELLSLAEQVGANKSAFLAWLNVETLDQLPASQFNKARHGLEARRGKA